MVSQYPNDFCGHRLCGSGVMYLEVKEQDFICSLKSHGMKAHYISC